MSEKIGFIGLGAMGMPMASNLVRKGFDVTAYDVELAKIERLAGLGAHRAASVAAAARGREVVVEMLRLA